MKLIEALNIVNDRRPADARDIRVYLACGFTPLHLQVFLQAHLQQLVSERTVAMETGLFGDCLGNVERSSKLGVDAVAVTLEWDDLDSRLGLRQLGGWGLGAQAEILKNVRARLDRMFEAIVEAARRCPVAVLLPTLPLPPVSFHPRSQAGPFDLELLESVSTFATRIDRKRGVRIVNPQRLEAISPARDRRDVKSELTNGFPYRLAHADSVASLLARLICPRVRKKGLITDLDDTLWSGILGEVGGRRITWDIEHQALIHGLYQQLLGSLGESGVLIGVASKNDRETVEQALARTDLVISRRYLSPIEANWGAKSESVTRILRTWNVSAEDVVFIDDSSHELAEVKQAHPEIECLRFPASDAQEGFALLAELRELFGTEKVLFEDVIRRESVERAADNRDRGAMFGASSDGFLRDAGAELTLDFSTDPDDPRALELINKTNQFNLNGMRYAEGTWRRNLQQPERFMLRVSFKDKFGPLGTIAVISGRRPPETGELEIDVWVMSCRAFSRRIEHRCLEQIFQQMAVEQITFDYQPTSRNGPMRDFFSSLLDCPAQPGLRLTRERFAKHCPPLFHRTMKVPDG